MTQARPQAHATVRALLARGPVTAAGAARCGAHVGISVLDAASGEPLLEVCGADAFVPASSQKLLSTSAALYRLGPDFRFETSLLAPPPLAGRLARLTLRGAGDPSLAVGGAAPSLGALAAPLRAAGVRAVGELRVDDSAYAWPRWGSGWMWDDPAYPLGALCVQGAGAPHVDLRDGIGADLLTDPAAYPLAVGNLLKRALLRAGVEVSGRVVRGCAETTDAVLTRLHSAPLAQLVRETNKASLNSYAEGLYLRLGLDVAGVEVSVSTPERSLAALGSFLAAAGVDMSELRVGDGSGLSRYNLVTPRQLARLLHYCYRNPVMEATEPAAEPETTPTPRQAFETERNLLLASLPVAGAAGERGGTLAARPIENANVYAKTGTMTGVSSLCGVLRTAAGRDLAFALLLDGYPGKVDDLRRLQDALLRALAEAF